MLNCILYEQGNKISGICLISKYKTKIANYEKTNK